VIRSVRATAVAIVLLAVSASPAAAAKIAYRAGKQVVVVYLDDGFRQPIASPNAGPLRWSGDGRFLAIGDRIVGRTTLPTAEVTWAPTGARAAFVTRRGGVRIWTPTRRTVVVPNGWGAQRVAWGPSGALAIGRAVCRGACGSPSLKELWTWRAGRLTRLLGPLPGDQVPFPFAWSRGGVLWWDWPVSGSVAADGVSLYRNSTRLATVLMYPDYVAACGPHLALAAGGDRYAMHGKRLLWDGRDVSRDPGRSWVSPACTPAGRLVAAASANTVPPRIGREHRAIWQLLPTRRRLTQPPPGWTDEYPRLLADGSLLFVRTRQTARKVAGRWQTTQHGRIELLRGGRLRQVAESTIVENDIGAALSLGYYGHYDWPDLLAVSG
jgi:hypothetical protein